MASPETFQLCLLFIRQVAGNFAVRPPKGFVDTASGIGPDLLQFRAGSVDDRRNFCHLFRS